MKKAQVKIGGRYTAKISGNIVTVRIKSINRYGGWDAQNESTGRLVRIKSAAKLRAEVDAQRGVAPHTQRQPAARARRNIVNTTAYCSVCWGVVGISCVCPEEGK